MKLTDDDLEFLDRIGAWTHIGLRKKILKNQEKAEEWDRLNSAFPKPIDWTRIRFFAVTEVKDDIPSIAELDFDYQEDKKIVERLKKRIEELELHHNKTTFHTNCEDCVFYVELQKILES